MFICIILFNFFAEENGTAAIKRKSDVTDGKTESTPEKKAKVEESSRTPTKTSEASA